MSRPPMRPAVDGHNGRPISWPSHPTRTRSARHGFGPPLGPAGREVAVIAARAAPLHRPTASIRAATRRTAMPSAGEAVALRRFTRLRHRFGLRHAVPAMPSAGEAVALRRFTGLRHRFGLRHAVRRCRQRVKLWAAVAAGGSGGADGTAVSSASAARRAHVVAQPVVQRTELPPAGPHQIPSWPGVQPLVRRVATAGGQ